mgnify:FL=1|jgi:hypothetical protein|nr:hypothetical protein [uncultured Peptostreptococcus sp.]
MKNKVIKLILATSLVAAISLPSVSSAIPRDGWQKSSNGWSYYSSGSQLENTWKKIKGKWYFFDGSGKMKTGWLFDRSYQRWYYFNPGGDMKTGWVKSANQWYFMRQNGQMAESGWAKYKGDFYYFGIDGRMRFDAWISAFPEEKKSDVEKYAKEGLSYSRYYVDKDGKYVASANGTYKGEIGQWKDTKEGKFFILSDGTVANGPTFIDGKLYLLLPELKIGYSYAEDIGYSYTDQDGVFQNKENLKFDKDGKAIAKNGDKLFENKETGKIEILK